MSVNSGISDWRRQIEIGIVLLLLLVVGVWGALCSRPAGEPAGAATAESVPAVVREPGYYADSYEGLVEFVVDDGQWLVLVLDPDGPSVRLPAAGVWVAAVAVEPADRLRLCGDGDNCVTVLSHSKE